MVEEEDKQGGRYIPVCPVLINLYLSPGTRRKKIMAQMKNSRRKIMRMKSRWLRRKIRKTKDTHPCVR